MGKYFGTDGIRGQFGSAFVNPDFAYRIGAAIGRYLMGHKPNQPLNVVIGRDTRASGPVLVGALTQGLNTHGVHVHDLGVLPTPAVAQSVVEQQADLGFAITASHNPASDNGIKLFDMSGFKFDEATEGVFERLIDAEPDSPVEKPLARLYSLDASAFYVNYVRSLLDQNCMVGWKVVLDLANGATYETSPAVFRRWGAELVLLGDNPNGENINQETGSEYPQRLGEVVKEQRAQIGIAHDGDGDRLVVCDENGDVIDGDVLLGLFGIYALRSGALCENKLITTVQSNLGLDHAIIAEGGTVDRVDIGDRNVAKRMRETGSNVGGESSGHIIFSDFSTTGDGLLAAVKLIDLMRKTGKSLSTLRKEISLFPQVCLNLQVAAKPPLDSLNYLSEIVSKSEKSLGSDGRVLIRYSGTEPKIRILVEGKSKNKVKQVLKNLEKAVRADLDVIDS